MISRQLSHDKSRFLHPENKMPNLCPKADDLNFLAAINNAIRVGSLISKQATQLDALYTKSTFPKDYLRLILVLYAPENNRILVTRTNRKAPPLFSTTFESLISHPRCRTLANLAFRLQMDFVLEPPTPVNLFEVGMTQQGEGHFEIGLEGLLYPSPEGKLSIFLPGDAFVRSIMGMGQLRDYLKKYLGEDYIRKAPFERFHSESYLSAPNTWLRLYRGYPVVGTLTKEKIEHALEIAIGHIRRTQGEDGKFLYYYDAARDTRWDHEHPNRDPDKNPYYNILRHAGGGLTCLYYEKYAKTGKTIPNIQRAIEFLIKHTRYQDYTGRKGAYIYSERKAKLGGTGIALYLAADYQLFTNDKNYQPWAEQLAWHLVNQITPTGEFIYYNIYLDKPVNEAENQHYFSFYYPGEAICGLAKYLHLIPQDQRKLYFNKLHKALDFLLDVRPLTRASEYTIVPSDSWLMMSIMELWDFPEMRVQKYADFVFTDAEKMVAQMYKVSDAPFPDYAGAFFYNFGDYPYADGARCEGLLGAYQLAVKLCDQHRAGYLSAALRLAAWSLMHLVNTPDAVYFARRPDIAVGGIRFKYTRQWFRIDTIQHVASFYAKLLSVADRIKMANDL